MTDAVEQAWRIAGDLGNRIALDGGAAEWPSAQDRPAVARRARAVLGKRHLASRTDQVYGLAEGSI